MLAVHSRSRATSTADRLIRDRAVSVFATARNARVFVVGSEMSVSSLATIDLAGLPDFAPIPIIPRLETDHSMGSRRLDGHDSAFSEAGFQDLPPEIRAVLGLDKVIVELVSLATVVAGGEVLSRAGQSPHHDGHREAARPPGRSTRQHSRRARTGSGTCSRVSEWTTRSYFPLAILDMFIMSSSG